MSKAGSFIFGSIIGLGAGLVAASLLIPEEKTKEVKEKLRDNDKLQDLKKKYDKGTEAIKTQLSSFPNNIEDDSELKDFDDIVIDDTDKDLGKDDKENQEAVDDLKSSETAAD
ncbi:DUF1269 domain-containing family protein [Lactobacillus sp.]|uniref:DUF1269 domain-containing family protein n=1 Tax=Lactobacillus sp. TaxID=1591 RepID=UPI001999A351|nr:DUF1269 domain-containing family protein [Lactobacillus sp.]MBD5429960.1 DUF1269 domain-containing family protein [Lactobacillus sp.]